MSERNKAQMRRVIEEVYNRGDLDAVDEVRRRAIWSSMPRPATSAGATAPSEYVAALRAGFPDLTSPSRTRSPRATWW